MTASTAQRAGRISIQRVVLQNYKSIAACDVELRPLTILVGPNGAGKSNFLDALRFVSDSLRGTLDHALRDRGGIGEVRRRSAGHPTHFGIRIDLALPEGGAASYAFRVAARPQGGHEIQREECVVENPALLQRHFFVVESGSLRESSGPRLATSRDRLYLVSASGQPEFRPVYEALAAMGFYNFNPQRIRDLQSPDPGDLLSREGENIAGVMRQLEKTNPRRKKRIEDYLAQVVPGVRGVTVKVIGPKETLEFRQETAGAREPWRFLAASMSDGTLRALGILVALFQAPGPGGTPVTLVGIEEPETALHPAAAGILLDSFQEASQTRQVLVTSHSPDLLDSKHLDTDSILAVESVQGATIIAGIDDSGRSVLRDRLYTAGDLLRMNQLHPAEVHSTGSRVVLFRMKG